MFVVYSWMFPPRTDSSCKWNKVIDVYRITYTRVGTVFNESTISYITETALCRASGEEEFINKDFDDEVILCRNVHVPVVLIKTLYHLFRLWLSSKERCWKVPGWMNYCTYKRNTYEGPYCTFRLNGMSLQKQTQFEINLKNKTNFQTCLL